jgi:Zn-dependent peptidase ImmA (M78 family)
MKIPTEFQLAARTWIVRYKRMPRHFGKCDTNAGIIYLDTKLKAQDELHVFLHELFHAIASTAGREKFNKDEELIDSLSALLAQAMRTSI